MFIMPAGETEAKTWIKFLYAMTASGIKFWGHIKLWDQACASSNQSGQMAA
jgi:hypothetical protein